MRHNIFTTTLVIVAALLIIPQVSFQNVSAETYQQHSINQQNTPITSQKCNEFTFDATQSKLPQSNNISYLWDFGDGITSSNPVVHHVYQEPGNYTVNLSITDNSGYECSTVTSSQKVRVNIPPQVFFVSEDQGCVNKPLTFDATQNSSPKGNTLRYTWNFGDGTTTTGEQYVLKSFPKGGDYKVQLTADDQTGTACGSQTIEKIVHINEPPKAEAGESVILKCIDDSSDLMVNFDASGTTDVNNDQLTYLWDFGDGEKMIGKEVSHVFSQTGFYDVKLIVSDNTNFQCGTSIDFVTVKINKAPKADAGKNVTVCTGETVDFDGSNSFIHKKGTAMAQWFFGDGFTKNGLNVRHKYNRPGIYQATLTLENKLNNMCPISRDTRVVTVNAQPTVSIKSLSAECVGKDVFFDASSASDSDGDELDYYWSFGDGSTSKGNAKVRHSYTNGGRYRVSVIVDDRKGTTCSPATAETFVQINTPPIANAGLNQSCCVNKKAKFSANASSDPDNNPLLYMWDFGDGTQKRGVNAEHTYTHSGSYNVVLTVDDQQSSVCSQSTDGFTAEVRDVPLPVIHVR